MATMNQRYTFSLVCVMLLCFAVVAAFGVSLNAQTPEDVLEVQCEGAIGTTQAGITIEVKQNTITGGHYFIAKDLLDIPVTGGAVHDGHITISAADSSRFELRFKSNDSEHGEKLNFDNSVGLIGTRQKSGKIEKVDLGFLTMGQ